MTADETVDALRKVAHGSQIEFVQQVCHRALDIIREGAWRSAFEFKQAEFEAERLQAEVVQLKARLAGAEARRARWDRKHFTPTARAELVVERARGDALEAKLLASDAIKAG